MDILGYVEVEPRIINEDNHVRLPLTDILLTHLHVLEDGRQVGNDRNDAHVSQFLVMLDTGAADSSHLVTTEEAELCLLIFPLQRHHQS